MSLQKIIFEVLKLIWLKVLMFFTFKKSYLKLWFKKVTLELFEKK